MERSPRSRVVQRGLRIGELAREAGISRDAIRFYERRGLLPQPPRTRSGYRAYPPQALDDLLFIKKAQALGLRLSEVREVLDLCARGTPPCDHIRAKLRHRLAEVDHRLTQLATLRTALSRALERLSQAAPPAAGCRCAVIETS